MFIQIIGYVLLCLVVIIALIDIFPIFRDWVRRIHIGRYSDKKTWNESITNVGIKWLNKTPKIKVTDNTRLVLIDMLKGNYTKNTIQHWQEASLLLGLSEYLKGNDDKKVKKEIIKYLNSKFDKNGQWRNRPKHVDSAILAYAVMKLDFINIDQYKKALDYTWGLIKDHIGKDGTVGYRKSMQNYRYVDTIGFICPFLVSYGIRYDNHECIDLAVKQIKEYEQYAMLEKHNILSHAYNIQTKVPLGLYGWGRGLGWYAIGLIDAWRELPLKHDYKSMLEQSIKRFAMTVIELQQENGAWNWTVTRNETRPDSSTTATLGWFLLNAAIVNDSAECLESSNRAIDYLMKITRRNGEIDFSQGDTKDIGVYSRLFNILPFTQGFSIRCINLYMSKKQDRSDKSTSKKYNEVTLKEKTVIAN